MKILSMQVALFSASHIERPDLLMNEINQRLGNILDGMPNILDLPPNAPPEIPIIQAKSINNIYALNITRTRVDFIISPPFESDATPADVYKLYKSAIERYYKHVLNAISIVRVGVIFTLFEPTEENNKAIFEKYFSSSCPAGCIETTLRFNVQKLYKDTVYNNVKTIEAINLNIPNATQKGVIINLDINNAVKKDELISAEIISYVLNQAVANIKSNALKELI